jgi:hypothetical protein
LKALLWCGPIITEDNYFETIQGEKEKEFRSGLLNADRKLIDAEQR